MLVLHRRENAHIKALNSSGCVKTANNYWKFLWEWMLKLYSQSLGLLLFAFILKYFMLTVFKRVIAVFWFFYSALTFFGVSCSSVQAIWLISHILYSIEQTLDAVAVWEILIISHVLFPNNYFLIIVGRMFCLFTSGKVRLVCLSLSKL